MAIAPTAYRAQANSARERDGRRNPHFGIKAGEIRARLSRHVARGFPIQQLFARHQHAHQRPPDGIQTNEGFKGKECQGERDLAELAPTGRAHSSEVHCPGSCFGLRNNSTSTDNNP